jgi:LacI family transcriptional regulator
MRDVARAAGVSIKTVSRVVNEQGEISVETRERVLAAIDSLGYRPSKLARALVTRHTDTIGLVIGDIANPYFSEVARGILDVAQEEEYAVFVCNTDGAPHSERRAILSLVDHYVDGLIVFPTQCNQEWIPQYATPARPMVAINWEAVPRPGLGIINTQLRQGACLAVAYLIEQGHHTVAMLAGDDGPLEGLDRFQGYRQALIASGRGYRSELVRSGPPTWEQGVQATHSLLAQRPRPTAIFCYNDLLALGAIQACHERGLNVPQECAVVGFDDIRISAMIDPPLTTIHVDKYEMGRQAIQQLLAMLRNPEECFPPIMADVELVRRASA